MNKDLCNFIGDAIKKARESIDKSQREFAELLGVSKSSLGRYERGDILPGQDFMDKLAEITGLKDFMKYVSPTDKAAPEVEVPARRRNEVIIQSPLGGEISVDEILKKVGDVDEAYVRVDHNRIYWVRGDEKGDVVIWD